MNDADRSRYGVHQHHPHPVDGRGAGGQLRPSGHADGHGAGGLQPVAAVPALRSPGSDLAQPRPLRALGRPRLDAALLAAAPDRRQGGQPGVRDARASRPSRWTTSSASASSDSKCPAIRSTAGPPASRPPPARWARAWPTASAWPSPAAGWRRTSTSPASTMFDFNVYALCGDGCMMEGISSEAASLAGHLKLSNLCWIYDNNHITIEGNTALAFSEDVATRFLGYGWNVTARRRRQRPGDARAGLPDVPEDAPTGRR